MKRFFTLLMLTLVVSVSAISTYSMPVNESQQAGNVTEEQALDVCKWYVTSSPDTDQAQRQTAATVILKYVTDTDKFSLQMGKAAMQLLDISGGSEESAELLMVYIAGEALYCLENNLKVSNAASFASAMDYVINYYSRLPKQSIKPLNKYLKMSPEKRKEALEKYYAKEN